ncbi:MAG: hypothetical protein J6T37_07525 [Bacteroidales bacterium]|nr:hypothetical protein [Bacteroidales bacterium]
MKKVAIGLMLILTLASCQNSRNGNGDKIVATVYDKILYQSDLQDVLYEGISFNDSLVRTKAFIDKWIRRQLLIHQAENTIDKSELDFSRQMEDYRNSLIIYKYESMLVEQNLDTVISEEEIEKYLKDNSPIEMDSVSVRNILLNMRRKELIEKMNNNLYNKAVKERVFKIY